MFVSGPTQTPLIKGMLFWFTVLHFSEGKILGPDLKIGIADIPQRKAR